MDLSLINQYRKKLLFKHLFYLFLAVLMILVFLKWREYVYTLFKDILNIIFSINEELEGLLLINFFIIYGIIVIILIFLAFFQELIYDKVRFQVCKDILSDYGVKCEKTDEIYFSTDILMYYAGDFNEINYANSHIIRNNHFLGQYFDLYEEVKTTDTEGNVKTSMKNVFRGYIFKFKLAKNYNCTIFIKKSRFHLSDIFPITYNKSRVKLDNPDFEKFFDVYSDDQINARYYLNQKRMEKLLLIWNENPIIIKNNVAFYALESEPIYISEIPFYREIKQEDINKIVEFYNSIENIYEILK